MDKKTRKYALSVLNNHHNYCKEYTIKHGRMHTYTLEQMAYTKGLKDMFELLAGYYLGIENGEYKLVPIEK